MLIRCPNCKTKLYTSIHLVHHLEEDDSQGHIICEICGINIPVSKFESLKVVD